MSACCLLAAPGCSRDAIQVYSIPKEKEPVRRASSSEADEGPTETPAWVKPGHWEDRGPGRMSVASFSIPGAGVGSAEVAIMPFPRDRATDLDLLNIWRSSLGLKLLDDQTLRSIAKSIVIAGGPANLYSVSAPLDSSETEPAEKVHVAVQRRPSSTWLFKIQGESKLVSGELESFKTFLASVEFKASEPRTATARNSGDTSASLPKWEVPAGWNPQPAPDMLLAKFVVTGAASATTEITVSAFPGPAGGMLMNVNRWRDQLKLGKITQDELAALTSSIQVAGQVASIVDMSGTDSKTGKPARVIAAVVPLPGKTWFFKMMGDIQLSETQKPEFIKFLQSLRFPDA